MIKAGMEVRQGGKLVDISTNTKMSFLLKVLTLTGNGQTSPTDLGFPGWHLWILPISLYEPAAVGDSGDTDTAKEYISISNDVMTWHISSKGSGPKKVWIGVYK